jgi:hypothetical protein
MNRLGILQERIALRLGETRDIIRNHLGKMSMLTKSPNTDLSQAKMMIFDRESKRKNRQRGDMPPGLNVFFK